MLYKKKFIAILAVAFCALSSRGFAVENSAPFEGTVSASVTRGGTDTTEFLFTRKGNFLRIENVDKSKPEPINVVDLAANKLTIIYPHNSTFVQVDLIRQLPDGTQMGAPNLPPSLGSGVPGPPGLRHDGGATVSQAGFPSPPNMNTSPGEAATGGAPIGPKISPPPGFPTPPPRPSMPAMPPMPNNPMASKMPAMPNNPMASGMPNMPGMPPMPPMGGFGGTPELKKTDKTKKIQGFDCTLYTISDRMETFEIWATNDSALFPFRLIQTNYLNRRFGPRMLEEQWVELVQKKSLFPLEATLRMDLHSQSAGPAANGGKGNNPGSVEHGQERLSFKADKIEKQKIDPPQADALFKPPENYQEIQAQPF